MLVLVLLLPWSGAGWVAATTSDMPTISGALTIFSATSLIDAFKEMGASVEHANPGAKLAFNFAGSSTLRAQLAQGARADVFASADEPNMHKAQQEGSIVGEPRIFVHNLLAVIVPAHNPAGIATLQDLAKPKSNLVLAHKDVPAGNYARQSLANMSQDPAFGSDFADRALANLVSEEHNVKQVVTKVQLGEADAGIVYASDITPAVRGAVKVIDIPDQFNIVARYAIAVVKGTSNEAGARAFIEYVLSPAGQAVLTKYGFIAPGA
jgi:molybdate transport system substrate-binding protein